MKIALFFSCLSLAAGAQGFQNLDFELATGIPAQPGNISFTRAFPGWTGYPIDQNSVLYDDEWLDTAGISILDLNYAYFPAAAGITHGHYCASLYSGFQAPGPYNGDTAAWLSQSGQIPATAVTLLFNYSGNGHIVVTFNGVAIPLGVVAAISSDSCVLGGDISHFASQIGELRFTAPHDCNGHCTSRFLLDYIRFSNELMQGQFTYTVSNGAISITGYTGPGDAVVVPSTINNLPVTSIGSGAFSQAFIRSVMLPDNVTTIESNAFYLCTGLTSVTFGNSVTNLGNSAFGCCFGLTNVTLPNSVTSIGDRAFYDCTSLTNFVVGNRLPSIGSYTFAFCMALPSITLPTSVTNIGDGAFYECSSLGTVYFLGNAPSLAGSDVFKYDDNIVYYLSGTSGWRPVFGGRPAALWIVPPTLQRAPQTQTVEAGSTAGFFVGAAGSPMPGYQWFFNNTNPLGCASCLLQLTGVQPSQAGAYTVVVTNSGGSVTSAPALLSVIAPVPRRMVPGLTLTGQPATSVNLDSRDALDSSAPWTTFDAVSLTRTARWYFDQRASLPPQEFYRVWTSDSLNAPPALALHMVPAITLTGNVGDTLRLDYINQIGPTDAWVTLGTVTLTSNSQLYFDTSSLGQPARLWRVVPVP